MNKIDVKFLKNGIVEENGVNFLNINLLSTKEEKETTDKKPNLFVFLLDNSGSMGLLEINRELTRLDYAKRAINNFIDNLEETDKVGLITFNSRTDLIIPIQKSNNKSMLKRKVNNISTYGCTNIGLGLDLAREIITKDDLDKYNCKIILLSDGDVNEGKGHNELVKDSEKCLNNGITISSLGIGDTYNSKLMNDICTSLFYHIKSLSLLDEILEKELSLSNKILYNNVKVTIKFNGLIELKDNLNDYVEKQYDNHKVIYVGNLISNINKNILIEIENNLEKEDIDFEIIVDFNKEESLTIKKTLKIVDKEEIKTLEEDKETLEMVTETLKRKTIQQSTLSYMECRDMKEVNKFNNVLRSKFLSFSDSMGLQANGIIDTKLCEVNSVTSSYNQSSVSDLKDSYCMYSSKSSVSDVEESPYIYTNNTNK